MRISAVNSSRAFSSKNFKAKIVYDQNFETFAKKLIKEDSAGFDELLVAQKSLEKEDKDTRLRLKEIEDGIIVEIDQPKNRQSKFIVAGLDPKCCVQKSNLNQALWGLMKIADPSSKESMFLFGRYATKEEGQQRIWQAELDVEKSKKTNPFWKLAEDNDDPVIKQTAKLAFMRMGCIDFENE